MTRALWWLYDIQGWHEAGAALFHQAAEGLESSGEAALRGRMLAQEGYFVGRLGRHQSARPLLDQALALLAGTANPSDLAEATFYRAMSAFHLGELGSARDLFHRASALAEGDEQPLLQLWVAYYSGLLALWAGEYEAAEQTFTATARSWAELGFRRGQAANLMMRGAALRLADRRDEALLPLRVSLQAAALAHDQTMIGMGFAQLGGLALDRGEYDAAQYLLSESVETLRGLVDPWILGRSLALLVRTEVARDDLHAARQAGAELLRCARASEALLIGEALYGFALIRQREGASGEALALLNALESGPADEDTRRRAIRLQAHVAELLTPAERAAAELGTHSPPLAWLERISADPSG